MLGSSVCLANEWLVVYLIFLVRAFEEILFSHLPHMPTNDLGANDSGKNFEPGVIPNKPRKFCPDK